MSLRLWRYYHVMLDDGRRCSVPRCSNRSQIFGDRDVESGWRGYCSECNARWNAWKVNTSLRACSKQIRLSLLSAFGIGVNTAMIIRHLLYFSHWIVRRKILQRHKFRVVHLLWLCCPQYRYMEDTDSEAEEELHVNPTLRTLIDVYVDSDSDFYRSCFRGQHPRHLDNFRLLDAVSTYLPEFSEMQYTCECPEAVERFWGIFVWCDREWLWNMVTEELFYLNSPPVFWQRNYYFLPSGTRFYWWCSGAR